MIGSVIPTSTVPAGAQSVELVPASAMRLIRDGEPSLWAMQQVSSGLSAAAQYAAAAAAAKCAACAQRAALRQTPNRRKVGPKKVPSRKNA